jgi:hypothetical protein
MPLSHTHSHLPPSLLPSSYQKALRVQEPSDVINDLRPDLKHASCLTVEDEVEVALPVADLLVLQARVALREGGREGRREGGRVSLRKNLAWVPAHSHH